MKANANVTARISVSDCLRDNPAPMKRPIGRMPTSIPRNSSNMPTVASSAPARTRKELFGRRVHEQELQRDHHDDEGATAFVTMVSWAFSSSSIVVLRFRAAGIRLPYVSEIRSDSVYTAYIEGVRMPAKRIAHRASQRARPGRAQESERPDNLAEQAYRGLRALILERKIPPGSLVVEGRLVDELRMSRTPVREALVRLIGEGLLVRADARSYSVRSVPPIEFFHSMQVREMLEAHAMDLAAGKVPVEEIDSLMRDIRRLAKETEQEAVHWQADDRLHLMFARASGNAVLVKTIETLRVNTRLFELAGPFGRVPKDGAEHLAILAAWRDGDVKGAKKALVTHLRNLQEESLAVLAGRG